MMSLFLLLYATEQAFLLIAMGRGSTDGRGLKPFYSIVDSSPMLAMLNSSSNRIYFVGQTMQGFSNEPYYSRMVHTPTISNVRAHVMTAIAGRDDFKV